MIPVRLELHNFLPYRSPDPIRFDGIHLACLTGPNGAGKSSLLDAVTWVLWGRARAKRDDELVNLGQGDMYVQLDFEQEGTLYRVLRRRARGRRGQGSLDLFIIQGDGTPMTITEPAMRATQEKINQILRLDYETFIHSAFLQQGRADAFTTKNPAERKKILSDILGLEQWAVYEDRVKEKLKGIDHQLGALDLRLQEIKTELAKEPQYQADLKTSEAAYASAQEALIGAQEQLDEVAYAPDAYPRVKEQQAAHIRRIDGHTRDLEAIRTEIAAHEAQIAHYQAIIDRREEITSGYEVLQKARAEQNELTAKLRQMSDLDKQYNELEKQLAAERARLEGEQREYETRITELERAIAEDTSEELDTVHQEIAGLEALEQQRDDLQAVIQQMGENRAGLDATQKSLAVEGQNLNERIEKLSVAEGATCPLCGQPLTEEHRSQLIDELTQERDEKREAYRQNNDQIKEIGFKTREEQDRIAQMTEDLKQLSGLRNQAGALTMQREQANTARNRLVEVNAELAAVQETLSQENFAADIREQLATIERERKTIGYDADSHEDTNAQLEQYAGYEKQHTQLSVAEASLEKEQAANEGALEREKRLLVTLDEEQVEAERLAAEVESLKVLVEEEQRRRLEVNRLRTVENTARERLSTAQQQLRALNQRRDQMAETEERISTKRYEEALYKELRLAFGKNGVPAMIIETAIPELETTANDLLSRMTDGRMNLRLTTQREKVTGGMSETLDIEIADELGTRSYELYSGGEAFRINFAIRVALSKMLARRAGAHLRTLFIDEGFGTQDETGRNKLVEAITAIQNDFDLILVITHIDELRDSFPVHVVIDKTPNGSMVTVR